MLGKLFSDSMFAWFAQVPGYHIPISLTHTKEKNKLPHDLSGFSRFRAEEMHQQLRALTVFFQKTYIQILGTTK